MRKLPPSVQIASTILFLHQALRLGDPPSALVVRDGGDAGGHGRERLDGRPEGCHSGPEDLSALREALAIPRTEVPRKSRRFTFRSLTGVSRGPHPRGSFGARWRSAPAQRRQPGSECDSVFWLLTSGWYFRASHSSPPALRRALMIPRRFFDSRRFSFAPAFGFVGRRFRGLIAAF